MKTNNRPMVKVIEFDTNGLDVEVERPMNDTEYTEYLEEQVTDTFAKLVSVEELSKQTISTLEKENQELKNNQNKLKFDIIMKETWIEIQNKAIETNFAQREKDYTTIINGYKKEIRVLEKEFDTLETKFIKQQDQFLKVVESVFKEHQFISWNRDTHILECNCKEYMEADKTKNSIDRFIEHIEEEIKSAIEKYK